jgi:hypothetical protein
MSCSKARAKALAVLGTLALVGAGVAGAEPVGFIATAINDVQVQPQGTTTFQAAIQDQEVSVGDTIRTGLDSQAKIILVDDTTLSIDEDTEITIQSLHVGAAATQDRSIIKQTRGRLRTVVGSAFGGQTRMEVHTPTAVVGVKGTDLTTEKDEEARITGKDKDKGQWLVCLVDGQIVVRAVVGDAASEPKPGNCVYSYGDGTFSEELANPANPFEVAFDSPSFAPSDFTTPESAPVGEGPGGGEGGFESDPVVDPPAGDEIGPTSLIKQDDIPEPPEPPAPPVDEDDPIIIFD